MDRYQAYSDAGEIFESLEAAIQTLLTLPWVSGRTVRAVSMVTQESSDGIQAKVVSGAADPEHPETAVFLVEVAHAVAGMTISIRYLVEFGEVDNGEDAGHEGNAGDEPGNETDSQESDGGAEQGGEESDDVPSDLSRPVDPGWDSIIDGDGSEYDDPADWTGEDDYY